MSAALEIDGKFLHPIKEAAQLVSYSRDYITRLAREKKITATYLGRQWFVDMESLKSYVETSVLENEIRKKQLSVERKNEGQLKKAVEEQHTLHLKKAKSLHARVVTVASLVLMFGLMTGLATNQLITFSNSPQPQVANTYDTKLSQSEMVANISSPVSDDSSYAVASLTNPTESFGTQEIRSLGDIQNGILLLPNGGQAEIEKVLSDKVVVRELSDGTKEVVRVDATGREVGNAVPFVVVPVERQEVQI